MGSTSDPARADALLIARLDDLLELSDKYSCPRFLGFLDERETALARNYLRKRGEGIRFYGGHPEAEWMMVGAFPDYYPPSDEAFPLSVIAFFFRKEARLTHREVLGTLLGAGIRREKLGDILCGEGLAVVMADEELVSFLTQQIDRIGGEGVRVQSDYDGPLPVFHRYRPIDGTIASPRLDAILKLLISSSREVAADMIRTGLVSVNHCVCNEVAATLREQDVLSVRGCGRYRIEQIGPETQKGRLRLTAVQYI